MIGELVLLVAYAGMAYSLSVLAIEFTRVLIRPLPRSGVVRHAGTRTAGNAAGRAAE